MTPATVAGLGALAGLDLVALTDHNATEHARAFEEAARFYGVQTLVGAEVTCSEDVHVVCLFENCDAMEGFSAFLRERRPKIQNVPDIFGEQRIVDADDELVGSCDDLLIYAADVGFNDLYEIACGFGGVAVPAHIDKDSNGAIAMLGGIPAEAGYRAFELFSPEKYDAVREAHFGGAPFRAIVNSDAHLPEKVGSRGGEIDLDCTREELPRAMLRYLRGE